MPMGSLLIQRLESRFHGNDQALGWEAQAGTAPITRSSV